MPDYGKLRTERSNPRSQDLDKLSVLQIAALMNRENEGLARAIRKEGRNIARAAAAIAESLRRGGRLFFAGAGTSGRLGVLEAAELPPTFGVSPASAQALMAGGRSAVFRSKEGAEDDAAQAFRTLRKRLRRGDILVGIAASGVTPFAQGALIAARRIGAETVLVTCNPDPALRRKARVVIAVNTGPEIIAGSTRLKAGTATKMVLNMLTTAAMVRLGKVYGNLMVDLQPKSRKLRERALRLVRQLTGLPRARALALLKEARWSAKTAILMARRNLSARAAADRLKERQGSLRACLDRR